MYTLISFDISSGCLTSSSSVADEVSIVYEISFGIGKIFVNDYRRPVEPYHILRDPK